MNIQFPGCFGNVKIVLKEAVDRLQGVLIQGLDGVLLEDLVEEHLTQGGGELIDDTAEAETLIMDDGLVAFKDAADVDGDLGLLVAVGLASVLMPMTQRMPSCSYRAFSIPAAMAWISSFEVSA